VPNPGFTLAEDAALKKRLQSLYVSDDRDNQRAVQVFFRYPDAEAEKLYPFITLDLVDIAFARSRQLSEVNHYYSTVSEYSGDSLTYFPSEYNASDMQELVGEADYLSTDQFVAVDLTYQVSTYCRSQRHDRQLTAGLLRYVFPMRRGFIDIPEDGTTRRCDLLDWRTSDVLDQETGYKKRVFRKVYTIQINSEIPQSDLAKLTKVTSVSGTLNEHEQPNYVPTPSFSEEF